MFNSNLRQKAEKALGVFRQTVETLSRINVEAAEKRDVLSEKIQKLSNEDKDLETLIQENDTVISKINNFLN